MEYQSLYKFYWFGTCLRYLQDASVRNLAHGDGHIVWNIETLFTELSDLKLQVTERLGHQKLDDMLVSITALPEGSFLTNEIATDLCGVISQLRETLEMEIQGIGAYTPTPKRLDLPRLLNDVSSLFAPGVFNQLPSIARFDFGEAGKCIAFERPTAAAFHILRAPEDVLLFYYTHMIRHSRISDLMWGPIVT